MYTYTINYDLRNQRNYDSLYQGIANCGTAVQVLESFWVLTSDYSAATIFDHLSQFIDGDDGLVVSKTGREGKFVNVNCSIGWLANNL